MSRRVRTCESRMGRPPGEPIRLSSWLRVDDQAERAAEGLDPVAVAHGRGAAVRRRREGLVAEQVERMAVPGYLVGSYGQAGRPPVRSGPAPGVLPDPPAV